MNNLPLKQEGVKERRVNINLFTTHAWWKLTGTCGGQSYTIQYPSTAAHLIFSGSDAVTLSALGTYSYREDDTSVIKLGDVTFSRPVSFAAGEYGIKTIKATAIKTGTGGGIM